MSADYPTHLRPVPDSGDSTAPSLDQAPTGTPGLTPPIARGRSTGFVTDVLVDLGFVGDDRARQAIEEARTAGRPPETLLLQQGAISADQLSRAVAERYGLDHIDLSVYHVDMAAANLISVNTARRYGALPVGFVDKETLLVAMADPTNVLAVDDIQIATGLDCRVAVAAGEDIEALIGRLNTLQSAVTEAVVEGEEEAEDELAEVSDMQVSAEDAPVIKVVYSILGQAVGEGASDIHFEPGEGEMRVRFRIDGVLREAAHVPKRMVNAVVSRVKIMSDLNIAEKRVPQDGRVSVTRRGPPRRSACDDAADPARRGGDDPHPRQRERAALARRAGDGRQRRASASRRLPQGLRRGSGHRPDRLGQVDDPLRGSPGAERGREEHHHDRGPGRVPAGGHQPDERQSQGGARLRHRAALDAARRPRHRDGGRDPRRGDRPDRDRGGAYRPHDADHPAHQRRAGRRHPAREDGNRVLPDRLGGRLRSRPAPRPQALHRLQAAGDRAARRR